MIQGVEIQNLINLFRERGVKFYHACQFRDFKSYLHLAGIPSRFLLENENMVFTPFHTDNQDRNNEVWNKVFGNLSDFGFPFARGNWSERVAPTPNPYGPILFVLEPEVLGESTDIAICLRSAGGRDFRRAEEALASTNEVNRIFKYRIDEAPSHWEKSYIKFSNELKEEFRNKNAMTPEVSCTVANNRLSFAHISKIVVDSYHINQNTLIALVNFYIRQHNIFCPVEARTYREERRNILNQLTTLLIEGIPTLNQIIQSPQLSEEIRDWARRLMNIEWQYTRFARYLRIGTILELLQ